MRTTSLFKSISTLLFAKSISGGKAPAFTTSDTKLGDIAILPSAPAADQAESQAALNELELGLKLLRQGQELLESNPAAQKKSSILLKRGFDTIAATTV